jgi:lysozyme
MNDRGLKLIMEHEGCRLEAYRCPAGVLTIGYGHTGDVREGQRITQHQAEAILSVDLDFYERRVSELVPAANENQFAACVSLAFNVGVKAFESSTLLRLFKQGKTLAAAGEFAKWTHVNGKVLPGLVKRRAAEAELFQTKVIRA